MRILLPRRLLRHFGRLTLVLFVFAQAMVVAHACSVGSAAETLIEAQEAGAGMPPCHADEDRPAAAPNLCVIQCTSQDQTAEVPQVPVFGLPAIPILTVARVEPGTAATDPLALAPPTPTDPPPLLRFGALRI